MSGAPKTTTPTATLPSISGGEYAKFNDSSVDSVPTSVGGRRRRRSSRRRSGRRHRGGNASMTQKTSTGGRRRRSSRRRSSRRHRGGEATKPGH